MNSKRIQFAGLCIDDVNFQELHAFIEKAIQKRKQVNLLHLNIHGACLAWKYPWLADFYQSAPLVFCDGNGPRWGLKLLGEKIPPKIPITRWVWDLAAFCEQKGFKLFLLGASPEVVKRAAENLQQKHPQLKLAGYHDGYFEKQGPENDKICDMINCAQPDILVIGFGMPVQEKWILDHGKKLKVPVFLPGGGVLDYAAGRLGKAPQWMLDLHLEWLFRVWQEPQRLLKRYLTEIPYFFTKILGVKLKRLFGADAK